MKKYLLITLFTFLCKDIIAQIGIGTTNPNSNAILEIASSNKGLLIPRVALTGTTNSAPLAAHVDGMLVYNTATTGDVTPGFYFNTSGVWTSLGSGGTGSNIFLNNGTITAGENRTVGLGTGSTLNIGSNSLHIDGDNKSVGVGTNDPKATLDVVANTDESIAYQTGKGILIPRFDALPNNTTQAGNDEGEMIYVNGDGFFYWTGRLWQRVREDLGVTINCERNGVKGILITGVEGQIEYSVTFSNQGIDNVDLIFTPNDLEITEGTGSPVINSQNITVDFTSATLGSGENITVTWTANIEAVSSADAELNVTIFSNNLLCEGEIVRVLPANSMDLAQATIQNSTFYTHSSEFGSAGSTPKVTYQINKIVAEGSALLSALEIEIPVNVTQAGQYVGFTLLLENDPGNPLPNESTQNVTGGGNNLGLILSYPAGEFTATGSQTILATIKSQGSFPISIARNTTNNTDNSTSQSTIAIWNTVTFNTMGAAEISLINRSLIFGNDRHLYDEITMADGSIWLNNDLGAAYADPTSNYFNPISTAQPDLENNNSIRSDFRAYGDLYQWGRSNDGHEQIDWINSTSGTPTLFTITEEPIEYGTSDRKSAYVALEGDWRVPNSGIPGTYSASDQTLWDENVGNQSDNDPCPVGFRVPTFNELQNAVIGVGGTPSSDYNELANQNTLRLTASSERQSFGGKISGQGNIITIPSNKIQNGIRFHYWVSSRSNNSPTDIQANAMRFGQNSTGSAYNGIFSDNKNKSVGLPIRCIKI